MLNNKIFQDLTKFRVLQLFATWLSIGFISFQRSNSRSLKAYTNFPTFNSLKLRGERQAKPETVAAARVVAVAIG